MLESLENERTALIRQRMQEAGCVFSFVVCKLPLHTAPDESDYKTILESLFARVEDRELTCRREFWGKGLKWSLRVELDRARPQMQDDETVRHLSDTDGTKAALFHAFHSPPYGTRLNDQAKSAFIEWLSVLRLYPNESIVVLDWVGDPKEDAARSDWSNYFDDGKEWWGIWCLTIWNPFRHTLSALTASATD